MMAGGWIAAYDWPAHYPDPEEPTLPFSADEEPEVHHYPDDQVLPDVPAGTLHLTEKDPYAVTPLCGRPRRDTDRYQPPAYNRVVWERQLADPAICPNCRRAW